MTKHMDLSASVLGGAALETPFPDRGRAGRPPMDLALTLKYIRRRIRLVVQCFVVGAGVCAAAALLIKPTFTATALLAVGDVEDTGQKSAGESAVDTQIAMLQSPNFMDRAIRALAADPSLSEAAASVPALERRMKIIQESKSRLISLSFSAKSATLAADAANRIARLYVEDPALQSVQSVDDVTIQYATRIKALEVELLLLTVQESASDDPKSSGASVEKQESLRDQIATLKLNQTLARRRQESRRQSLAMTPPVQLVALATPPSRRSSLNPIFIAIPGSLFSGLLGIGLALTAGRLDRRVYAREDLEEWLRQPCAGAIPPKRSGASRWRATGRARLGYARAVEAMMTEVVLMPAPRPRILLMAASEAHKRDATIVEDCAAALARVIPRVVVVDLDLFRRAPRRSLFSRLSWTPETRRPDTLDVLSGRRTLGEAIERRPGGHYAIPLTTPTTDDAFSLLATGGLRRMLDDLQSAFDLIIVAGPPASGVHETRIIATHADAALIFARSGVSREDSILAAVTTASQALSLNPAAKRPRLYTALIEAPAKAVFVPRMAFEADAKTRAASGAAPDDEAASHQSPLGLIAAKSAAVEGAKS